MDTSLAEEVQQTMATLAPNRFFFMSPYRSFTTSGCFARFDEPAVNGDSPDSPFQQKLAALFADAKAQGIKNPVMVGAIPSIHVSLRRCIFPNPGSRSPVRKNKLPHAVSPAASR
ncbi:hypothetical protein MUTS15_19590 [Escherichia coli]|nr:hypothetical protein MUTS15_19590 [Escherichia coli]